MILQGNISETKNKHNASIFMNVGCYFQGFHAIPVKAIFKCHYASIKRSSPIEAAGAADLFYISHAFCGDLINQQCSILGDGDVEQGVSS